MRIIISIIDNKVEIALKNGRKKADETFFLLENNLTEKLLPEIDKLLGQNNLRPKNVEKVSFRTDMKNSFTTVRIGKAVANAFNWAKDRG